MAQDWSWCFDKGAFVLRDRRNRRHASILLHFDGRWRWDVSGASGYAATWEEGMCEVLGQFDLLPDDAEFFAELANEEIEHARLKLSD